MWILFICNSCVVPAFSFEWNKEILVRSFFTENIDFVYQKKKKKKKKTQQTLYLLRKQKRSNISPYILESVYRGLTESVLTFNIVVSIDQTEWWTISECPSLMRSLNGGLTLQNCMSDAGTWISVLCLRSVWFSGLT